MRRCSFSKHLFAANPHEVRESHGTGATSGAQQLGEASSLGADPLLEDDFSPCSHDAHLALPLVHVDADELHCEPPLSELWGCWTTTWVVSCRFIPSIRFRLPSP